MKQAPLQLLDYYMTSLSVRANPAFHPEKMVDLDYESIQVTHTVTLHSDQDSEKVGSIWCIGLTIQQALPKEKNIPYGYDLNLMGYIAVHPDIQGESLTRVIHTNGPSMLFGVAREMIKSVTSKGPFAATVIPSTTFYSPAVVHTETPSKPSRRKISKKSTGKKPSKS